MTTVEQLDGLLLGHEWELPSQPVGFHRNLEIRAATGTHHRPVLYHGDAPLLTIAPTGAGKGVGVIIPNLLRYRGPVVVVDPKGEAYAVTARRRQALGQRVLRFDPFGVLDPLEGKAGGALNPLDLIDPGSPTAVDDAMVLAESIVRPALTTDPHWEIRARQILTGFLLFAAVQEDPTSRHLGTARSILVQDEDGLTGVLGAMRQSPLFHNRIAECAAMFLAMPDKERGSVLSTMTREMDIVGSPAVTVTLAQSSLPLRALQDGEPISLYLILPPDRLASHSALLRLWLSVVITLVARRRLLPARQTLLLVDEAAQLGHLSLLETAITLLRGLGLQTWTFWQDLSQVQALYPLSWRTIVGNAQVIQSFGFHNRTFADSIAALVGYDGEHRLLGLPDEIALIAQPRCAPHGWCSDRTTAAIHGLPPCAGRTRCFGCVAAPSWGYEPGP
jgi:type IV secretion system protein VirD4